MVGESLVLLAGGLVAVLIFVAGMVVNHRIAQGRSPVGFSFPAITAFTRDEDVPPKPEPDEKTEQIKQIDVCKF